MILAFHRIPRSPVGQAGGLSVSVLAAALALWPAPARAEGPAQDAQAGAAAYQQFCARCHGAQGKGDGLDAKRFYPRPRDLTLGIYKFRSTASGTPPTDEDLFALISRGLPGSNMPDWQHLDEAIRWHLVDYLKSLAPIFKQTAPAPVDIGTDPGAKRADVARGRAVYEQLGCAACHGAQGRANGMSAAGLVDDWGMPIRPANLTQGWAYRGGADARAVMTRFMAGIDGTGMPSYDGAVAREDAWHLAYYVASLQEPARWNMIARAAPITGALPETPDDPRWAQAERTDVRLRNAVTSEGEWALPPTVRAVTFKMLYTDEGMAFLFSWDDPTGSRSDAPDAAALVMKTPGTHGDVVTLQAWPYAGAPALDFCYWSEAAAGQASELLSTGFERVRSALGNPRPSAARYLDGRWQLVVQRPRHPGAPEGAAGFTVDHFTPLAFVIWDGGNPTARAVSPWVDVALAQAGAASH